jgi:hypothetical protein
MCARAQGGGKRARAPKLAGVFVKREGQSTFVEVVAPAGASVAALLRLIAQDLKLEAPLDAVTLTKEGADTPLDSTLTVQEALGGVARPRLIVKVVDPATARGACGGERASGPRTR